MNEEKVFTVWTMILRGGRVCVPDARIIPMDAEKAKSYEVGKAYTGATARPWERALYCGYFDGKNKVIDIPKATRTAKEIYEQEQRGAGLYA